MILAFLSLVPIVITTHFPRAPIWWVVPFSTLFFVLISGRFVPAMAMMNGSAAPHLRGSFLSVMSSLQAMAMGVATMLASTFLSLTPAGEIAGYGNVGWFACAMTLLTIWLSKKMKAVS